MSTNRYQQTIDDYRAAYASDPTPANRAAKVGAERTADATAAEATRAAYNAAADEAARTGSPIAQILRRERDAAIARRNVLDDASGADDTDEPTPESLAEFLIYEANDAALDATEEAAE